MFRRTIISGFIFLFISKPDIFGQEEADTSSTKFIPNVRPELTIPKLNPGKIKIDGVINEDVSVRSF